MAFCVLPALATVLTPVRYRDVISRTKDALVTAFATDSLLIVLPLLAHQGKELTREAGLSGDETDSAFDVIVPASFNFPNAGKLLQLTFVLFAAWFVESAISVADYLKLMFSGLLAFFGKPVASMPYLLDLMRVPADMFQLYIASGILASRFGTLVSAMQTFVLAVIGAFAMAGLLRVRWRICIGATASIAALLLVFAVGARLYFERALEGAYEKDQIIAKMQVLEGSRSAIVHEVAPDVSGEDLSRPTLDRIRERGFIRVGQLMGMLPFAYSNGDGELVGFDVAMAHELADELGVDLEFVPLARDHLAIALDSGQCDVIMSGLSVTPMRAERMAFSESYLDTTMALVVKDHRREEFASRTALQSLAAPRIAVLDLPHYVALMRKLAPNAELVPIQDPLDFFEDTQDRFDAMQFSAEMGSAYSLLHPEFSVSIPYPDVVKVPVAYPVARGDPELLAYLDAWVDLKKKDGTIQRLYDYWILGKNAVEWEPRWSVIRNVLHWVD
jgi:ABC-type amino acid transport substrate-binding protein